MSDQQALIGALLTRAGLPASDDEIAEAASIDVAQSYLVALLYGVREARYANPAAVFSAVVDDRPWNEVVAEG